MPCGDFDAVFCVGNSLTHAAGRARLLAGHRLDLSPRGIPLEPVGFSANPTLLKGKPTPKAAQFEHGEDDTLIDIRLHSPRGKPQAN